MMALGAMVALLIAANRLIDWAALAESPWIRIGITLATVMGAAVVYLAVLVLCGLRPRAFLRPPR